MARTITTTTGLSYEAVVTLGQCDEVVEDRRVALGYRACGAAAKQLTVSGLPAGRRPARACYCAAHGGPERAARHLARDWDVAAPASVGHGGRVLSAGCDSLCSPDAYVVIRHVPAAPARECWTVLPSRIDLSTATPIVRERQLYLARHYATEGEARAWHARHADLGVPALLRRSSPSGRAAYWTAALGLGSMLHELGAAGTRDEALAIGLAAWREHVRASVAGAP